MTDAGGHTTTFTYGTLNRLASRLDPLGRKETYTYDADGHLTAVKDGTVCGVPGFFVGYKRNVQAKKVVRVS